MEDVKEIFTEVTDSLREASNSWKADPHERALQAFDHLKAKNIEVRNVNTGKILARDDVMKNKMVATHTIDALSDRAALKVFEGLGYEQSPLSKPVEDYKIPISGKTLNSALHEIQDTVDINKLLVGEHVYRGITGEADKFIIPKIDTTKYAELNDILITRLIPDNTGKPDQHLATVNGCNVVIKGFNAKENDKVIFKGDSFKKEDLKLATVTMTPDILSVPGIPAAETVPVVYDIHALTDSNYTVDPLICLPGAVGFDINTSIIYEA